MEDWSKLYNHLVNAVELCLHQRPLHLDKIRQHVVVDVDDELKVARLLPEDLGFAENLHGTFRDLNGGLRLTLTVVEQLKVLDFPQQTDQSGVKIDAKHDSIVAIFVPFTAEEGLLELVLAGVLQLLTPLLNLTKGSDSDSGECLHNAFEYRASSTSIMMATVQRFVTEQKPQHR